MNQLGLCLLCWNAASLIAHGTEFLHILHTFTQQPHVICIQETNLNSCKQFNIKYYTLVTKHRNTGIARGGVAIFVRNDIHHTIINTDPDLEIIKIQINFNNQCIDIINVYNPPYTKIDYNKYCQLITNNNTILCGDFNARISSLLADVNNTNGTIMERIVDDCDLHIINDLTPTRYGVGGSVSIIDLAIVTSSMVTNSACRIIPFDCGSDHRILHITVGDDGQRRQQLRIFTQASKCHVAIMSSSQTGHSSVLSVSNYMSSTAVQLVMK